MSEVKLVLAVTGATTSYAARLLLQKSPWPVALVVSAHGQSVYEHECGHLEALSDKAAAIYDDHDLAAPPASGSVPTIGMVVLPCTTNTLGKIAAGIADTLITRAAHCHLKEQRRLVLCVRESPWSGIDFHNAQKITAAGGIVMPLSPPGYMFAGQSPQSVSMHSLLAAFVDRVLAVLGHNAESTWEDLC